MPINPRKIRIVPNSVCGLANAHLSCVNTNPAEKKTKGVSNVAIPNFCTNKALIAERMTPWPEKEMITNPPKANIKIAAKEWIVSVRSLSFKPPFFRPRRDFLPNNPIFCTFQISNHQISNTVIDMKKRISPSYIFFTLNIKK